MVTRIQLCLVCLLATLAAPLSADPPSFDQLNLPTLQQAATGGPSLVAEPESAALEGGRLLAFRTGEGRYCKLQVLGAGDALTARWETIDADGMPYASGDDLVVPRGGWVDLDTGTVLIETAPEADVRYDGERLTEVSKDTSGSIAKIIFNDPILPPPDGGGGSGGGGTSNFGTTLSSVTLSQNLFSTSGDADGDGLRDTMENVLADTLRPYYRFDSAEGHRQSFEPVTLFQVRPDDLCSPGKLKVLIRWVFLFASDGGYGPSSWCGDDHPGDNDIATFYLTSTNGGTTWSVTSITLGSGGLRWPYDISTLSVYQNTHPVIYMSAHKHHEHFDTSYNHHDSPYSAWGCNEDVNGSGAKFLSNAKSVGSSTSYNNVGELNSHSAPFVNSVGQFYSGHSAWGSNNFFDVGPNRDKWTTHAYAPLNGCFCSSGSTRTQVCTTPQGTFGNRTDVCRRGMWDLGVCVGGGGPHPE